MDGKITDRHIADIARELADWKVLRPYLGLNETHEAVIKESGDPGAQRRGLLQEWRRIRGNAATYGALIEALTVADNVNLAGYVRSLIAGNEGPRIAQDGAGE